jgi:hypothetical protein
MSGPGEERWRAVSPYRDRALDLAGDERAAWLAALRSEDPSEALKSAVDSKSHDFFLARRRDPRPRMRMAAKTAIATASRARANHPDACPTASKFSPAK